MSEFLKLTSSPLMNLDHTYRYSGTKLVEAESLSQHIVDTIMMGLKIIDEINHRVDEETRMVPLIPYLDPQTYILKAVTHDLEEAITGDVPRPLKYHDEVTLNSMREIADEVAKSLFEEQFLNHEYYYKEWLHAKDGKEGCILKIVDMLVVASKVQKEITLLNNLYMLRVAYEVSQYIKETYESLKLTEIFEEKVVVDYLLDLLGSAYESMIEILTQHESIMRTFNIDKHSMI